MESISWQDQDGARWIELEGELDGAAVLDLKDRFEEAVRGGDSDVVVVMRGVGFLSSTAAGLLVNAQKTLQREKRNLQLREVPPPVHRALELMALHKYFEIS